MYILCPEGYAVNLDYVRSIKPIMTDSIGYSFTCMMTAGPDELFNYPFIKYTDSKEELFIKVQNIRNSIMSMVNGGVMPKEILGGINLKKETV